MKSNPQKAPEARQACVLAQLMIAAAITLVIVQDARADRPKQAIQQGSRRIQATPPQERKTKTPASAQPAAGKVWSSPASKERYLKYRQEEVEARRNEVKAWDNYIKKLDQAERDVRAVRDGAYRGAVKGAVGGPGGAAAGAAWGGAKAAAGAIYDRGKDYYNGKKQVPTRQSKR